MTTTIIDGRTFHVDHDGYLIEPGEWDEELAQRLAGAAGIELTDAHWNVLSLVREAYLDEGRVPALGRIVADTGIVRTELRRMFLADPLWMITHLAGLPAPRQEEQS